MPATAERAFQLDLDGKSYPCVLSYPTAGPTSLGVVLAHGAGGDLSGGHLPLTAKHIAEAGYPCVRFTCKPIQLPTRCKVFKAVMEEVMKMEEGSCIKSWVFAGHSMGSRVAAACSQETSHDVKGCLFFSYPLHPPGKPEQLRDSPLCDLTLPLMFVRGTNDLGFCQPDKFDEVKLRLKSTYCKVHEVQGGDHGLKVKGGAEANRKATAEVYEAVTAYLQHVSSLPSVRQPQARGVSTTCNQEERETERVGAKKASGRKGAKTPKGSGITAGKPAKKDSGGISKKEAEKEVGVTTNKETEKGTGPSGKKGRQAGKGGSSKRGTLEETDGTSKKGIKETDGASKKGSNKTNGASKQGSKETGGTSVKEREQQAHRSSKQKKENAESVESAKADPTSNKETKVVGQKRKAGKAAPLRQQPKRAAKH